MGEVSKVRSSATHTRCSGRRRGPGVSSSCFTQFCLTVFHLYFLFLMFLPVSLSLSLCLCVSLSLVSMAPRDLQVSVQVWCLLCSHWLLPFQIDNLFQVSLTVWLKSRLLNLKTTKLWAGRETSWRSSGYRVLTSLVWFQIFVTCCIYSAVTVKSVSTKQHTSLIGRRGRPIRVFKYWCRYLESRICWYQNIEKSCIIHYCRVQSNLRVVSAGNVLF